MLNHPAPLERLGSGVARSLTFHFFFFFSGLCPLVPKQQHPPITCLPAPTRQSDPFLSTLRPALPVANRLA